MRFPGFARFVAIMALVMSMIVPLSASAQATTSYTSQLSGQVIQTTGPWTVEVTGAEVSDGVEMVTLLGQYDGMIVAWLPAGTDLVMARDIFLGEFSTVFDSMHQIDRGAYGNVSYSLDITASEGIEFGIFSLFLGQRQSGFVEYYLYFGPVSLFSEGMASAKANVTIGGAPVFDGVEPAGLQELLSANAGVSGASTQAPDTNVVGGQEAPTEVAAPQPTQAPAPTEVAAPQPTQPPAPTQETATTGSAEGDAYLAAIQAELDYLQVTLDEFIIAFSGMSGPNPDASAAEINRIAGEWISYPDRAATIIAPAGYEDIDQSYRTIVGNVEALGASWYLVVDALQAGTSTEQPIALFLEIMGTVQEQIDLLNSSLTVTETGGETSGTATAPPTEEPQAGAGENTDMIGGETDTDAREDLQNETETGQTSPPPTDPGSFAELGLVEEGLYESPQHGVEVTWDETLVFAADLTDPVISETATGRDSITLQMATGPLGLYYVDIVPGANDDPESFAAYWASDEYLAESGSELLLFDTSRTGSAGVLTREFLDDGTPIISLREVTCGGSSCEVLIVARVFSMEADFATVYSDVRRAVDADGERLISVFSNRDIIAALEQ